MALTPKQKAFIAEYLVDFNATQAAIRAGYSERSAYSIGWENLRKPEISDEIDKQVMSAQETLLRISEIATGDISEFLRFDEGMRLPIIDFRKAKDSGKMKLIKKLKYHKDGAIEFELYPADNALSLIGKHHKLFTDRHEHEHSGDITINKGYGVISPDDWDTEDNEE